MLEGMTMNLYYELFKLKRYHPSLLKLELEEEFEAKIDESIDTFINYQILRPNEKKAWINWQHLKNDLIKKEDGKLFILPEGVL